jgi:hypothetical protein
MPRRRRPWRPGDGDLWKEAWPTYAAEQRAAAEERTRVEITEAAGPSNRWLRAMSYAEILEWCADADGILRPPGERFDRAMRARKYSSWWPRHIADRHWRDVLADSKEWLEQERTKWG